MGFFKKAKSKVKKTVKKITSKDSLKRAGVAIGTGGLSEVPNQINLGSRTAQSALSGDLKGKDIAALGLLGGAQGIAGVGGTALAAEALKSNPIKGIDNVPFIDPTIEANAEAERERKRRSTRRGNIITRNLGQLVVENKLQRTLTGQ